MEMIKVEPVKGRFVRVPETGRQVTEPVKVPASSFWLRRIGDGDITVRRKNAFSVIKDFDPTATCDVLKRIRKRNEHQL